jgi:tetratricopeptide (TPR) repeat protein
LDQRKLVETACQVAGRNLSLEEWQQYISSTASYQKICPNLPYHKTVYDNLLKQNQVAKVLAMYNEDLSSNPTLKPASVWLAGQAVSLIGEYHFDWSLGNTTASVYREQALSAYDMAVKIDPTLGHSSVYGLDHFCFYGADPAPTESVMHACNYAVEMEPNNGLVYAIRAKARGKSGDLKGAQADLEKAQQLLSRLPSPQTPVVEDALRVSKGWLDQLKAGQDPFKGAPKPNNQ